MRVALKGLVLIAALINLNTAVADHFTKEIFNFDSNQCEDSELAVVTEAFANAFDVEVISAMCDETYGGRTELILDYIATEKLAVDSYPRATSFPTGRYISYEDCQASLAADTQRFIDETGASPWYVWCSRDILTGGNDAGSYSTHYSIKKQDMAIKPMIANILINSVGKDETDKISQITSAVRSLLDNSQISYHSVQVKKSGVLLHSNVVVHYYSDKRVNIDSTYNYKLNSNESCELLAQAFNSKLLSRDIGSNITFCLEGVFKGEFELNHIFLGRIKHRTQAIAQFDKISECVERKMELDQLAQSRYGERYIAGECSRVVKPGKKNYGFLASFLTL